MIRRRTAAIAAGAVLLISGVAVGCTAADASAPGSEPTTTAPADTDKRPRDHSKLVIALAEGLGIDEAKAQEAVDKAIDEVIGDRKDGGPRTDDQSGTTKPESGQPSTAPQSGQPSAPSGTPSAPSHETRRETIAQRLAAVIADELDADEAKVLQIVKDNMPERPDRGERGDRGDRGDRGERGNRGDGSGRPDDSGNTATPSPEPTR